jgi:hypothetical protein
MEDRNADNNSEVRRQISQTESSLCTTRGLPAAISLGCHASDIDRALPLAQTSMAGKTCLGTFEMAHPNPDIKWNMGAVRVSFTSATAGMLEFSGGNTGYQNPESVQTFESRFAFSDASFDGERLKLTGGPSKLYLTGDGTRFSGVDDLRPRLPFHLKLSCK